jgi:DNA-binding NarL/FixJ family response regulator
MREGIQHLLSAHDDILVVAEAADGFAATIAAAEVQPHVVLMDAGLPIMGGSEATRQIKEQWPKIRVLFFAADAAEVKDGLAAGADACLMKESGESELLEGIRALAPAE